MSQLTPAPSEQVVPDQRPVAVPGMRPRALLLNRPIRVGREMPKRMHPVFKRTYYKREVAALEDLLQGSSRLDHYRYAFPSDDQPQYYHRATCRRIVRLADATILTLPEAVNDGLRPCRFCCSE